MTAADLIRSSQEAAIAGGAKVLGYVCTYNASMLRIGRAQLAEIFESEGFGSIVPLEETLIAACNRAARKRLPQGFAAIPFKRPNPDVPHAVGIYRRVEVEGERGDRLVCGARVRVKDGTFVVADPEDGAPDKDCHEIATRIAADATRLVHTAETQDVTGPCRDVLEGPLGGFKVKQGSGVYFLRAEQGERWSRLASKLNPAGLVDVSFPIADGSAAQRSAGVVAKAGLEADLAELRKDLAGYADAERRPRVSTVDKRCAEVDAILAKADLYKELLGDWITQLALDAAALQDQFKQTLEEDEDVFNLPSAKAEESAAT